MVVWSKFDSQSRNLNVNFIPIIKQPDADLLPPGYLVANNMKVADLLPRKATFDSYRSRVFKVF